MNPVLAGFGVLAGMLLAGLAVSLWTLSRVRLWLRAVEKETAERRQAHDAALDELRRTADGLAAKIEEVRQQAAAPPQIAPRSGLNLGKRSQALRMHRRGDSADQIAASLEVPRQEVDLLLKVHRIVITSMM